jgi:3-polyprenyl-4-hydroxybenzoate decarboxylase
MQADRILKIPGAAGSSLDPSSHGKTTWKVGFDATIPMDADRSLYVKAVPKPRSRLRGLATVDHGGVSGGKIPFRHVYRPRRCFAAGW